MKKILLVLFLILSGCSKSVTPQKKEDENKVLTSYQLELIYEYDRHHDNYEEFVLYVDEDSVYYYIEDLNQITEKIMRMLLFMIAKN